MKLTALGNDNLLGPAGRRAGAGITTGGRRSARRCSRNNSAPGGEGKNKIDRER